MILLIEELEVTVSKSISVHDHQAAAVSQADSEVRSGNSKVLKTIVVVVTNHVHGVTGSTGRDSDDSDSCGSRGKI